MDPDTYSRRVAPINMTQIHVGSLAGVMSSQLLSPFMDRRWDQAGMSSRIVWSESQIQKWPNDKRSTF
jgi:hypothetical protein